VDNCGARFVILLLRDPHLLEGGQRGQDGATDPDGVLALRGRDDLDLKGRRRERGDLLLHAISNTGVHGGAARQDDVGIEILADINVALHDRVVGGLVDAARFHAQERGLEEGLRATETLVADGDDLTIGKFVRLFERGRRRGGDHFLFEVKGDVAQLLLDVTDDFALSGGGERVAALGEDLHQVVSQIATGKIETQDGVGQSVTFIDGYGMRDTIAGVKNDTSGTTGRVEREDGLNGDVHGGRVEGLEHDLGHLFTIGLRVERRLGEEDRVLFRGNAELVVERMMPDLLHVVPVGDDTVLDRVLQGEDTSLRLGLIADVRVLLTHTDHDTLMTRAADDGREHGARSVVTGETGLAHAGAIVNYESGNIVVTHFRLVLCRVRLEPREVTKVRKVRS